MSRRLLRRGRYPKGPGIEQMTNPSSQVPSTTSPACPPGPEMPYYGSSVQTETAQNPWTQPSYPNPASYQQNQVSQQPVPDTSSYWSGGQMYPSSVQASLNEQWNWKPENNIESSSYSNYQQPHPLEQWQQVSYSQIDNQNYSSQPLGYNPSAHQVYQPAADYQTGNNNTNTVLPNTSGSAWENGELSITQPEQLPWTYSAPQYCNPSYSTADFSQNSNAVPTNTSIWTVNSDQQSISKSNHMQEESSVNYLSSGSTNLSGVASKVETITSEQIETSKLEVDNDGKINTSSVDVNISDEKINNPSEHSGDNDYGSSTLSAFFQSRDVDNSSNNSESGVTTSEIKGAVDLTSLEEKITPLNLHENESNSRQSEEHELDNKSDEENLENNFLQEENINGLDVEGGRKLEPDSPVGSVEEPVNQEVPEPHTSDSSKLQQKGSKQNNKELPLEEPLNQQIPAESGQKSRSASCEPERVIIRPREESPFKPPRGNNTSKSVAIVQQEKSAVPVQKHADTKASEGKTIVQEVNLETFPDNLERPPDYEELRKLSPLYVSHQKHLRNELNNSPSSLLCDNPDIPYVTLAPAAPPLHSSSKSDKSESSSDSKPSSNTGSLYNFVPSDKTQWPSLNESNVPVMLPSMPSSKTDVGEKRLKTNQLSATSSSEIKTTKSVPSSQSKKYDPMSSVGRNDEKFVEQNEQQQHLYLKESKINGSTHPNNRNSDSPRKNLANVEYLEHAGNPAINISNRNTDSSSNVNYMRMDPRYQNNHSEINRQRFADQKYPSFDERQYYSDRERSRPPSTTSIGEKPEDYYYGNGSNRRGGPPENARPSSRMSESDLSRGDRNGQYGYTRQQYPYAYPTGYSRNAEYYQRHPNYRGYECDPYQRYPYYAPYYDAYGYDYSNYNYGFYDELYRNDPRYRQYREAQEQYRQYYAKYGYETDYDRSSIRSGRSSANELSKDMSSSQYPEPDIDSNESEFSTYNLQQNYSYDDVPAEVSAEVPDQISTPSARLTPVKYSYAHPIARFSPSGMLITVMPNPLSTALATPVTIHSLQVIMENEESFQELKNYQGPLVRGLTHKNDVIEFCSQKIKSLRQKEDIVDRESYILLWELMIVLLRQNGSVAGSDIAELLLKDHEVLRPHTVPLRHAIETPQGEQSPADINDSSSQSHAGDTSSPDEGIVVLHDKSSLNTSHTVDVDKVTRKFREFLLFGHKKDALEWAMKHGLWGHALFLASKMDLRTYANVMTRFANSLALNDPLQTLYQLMSGRQPSAVTCVADKKWGDWRPHLAMILSNPSTHPDVDSRSITTLGDTLASRGCLPAAHFCYIMAQVEFGTFEQKNSKVVLLTADHTLSFDEFATNEAIQCTEIYEYAQSLANPGYMLTHLQLYKFLYALRLVEHGFLEEALHYCEVIAGNLQVHPNLFSLDFISEVFKLATQLKYHDPHFLRGQGEFEEQDDPEWLKNLSALVQNYSNILQAENPNLYYEQQLESSQNMNSGSETNPQAESSSYQSVSSTVMQNEINNSYNYYQPNSWNQQNSLYQNSAVLSNNQQDNQSVNSYYQPEMMKKFNTESSIPSHEENETTDVPSSPVTQTPPFDYYSGGTQQEWSSVHSLPSVSLSDVGTCNQCSKSDLEMLVQKEETESDIALCSSAHSTPLHNYLLSKGDSDDRQMLMTQSEQIDVRILNSCLKSVRSHNSKHKKCIKFDASVSGHQGRIQRSGIRRRKFSRKKNEPTHNSDSSPEGSPSKNKSKNHKLSLLASLGILRSQDGSTKLTKRKRKAKLKNETIEKLLQSKTTYAIDEPCDTDESQWIQKEKTIDESVQETKKIISILKKLSEEEKKNSELSQLMANEFNKKPPLIFGGTYPIDEPFESSREKSSELKITTGDLNHPKDNLDSVKTSKKYKHFPQSSYCTQNKFNSVYENTVQNLERAKCIDKEISNRMSPLKMFKKMHSSGKKLLQSKEDIRNTSRSTTTSSSSYTSKSETLTTMLENKQSSYEAVNSYNNSSTPRERRDSAMSTASRYSSGSLSVSNKNRESQKPEPKKEKPSNQAGKTWLGGIFSRLLPKAPNQMILPDDKNPTIVWDDVKNCWVNKDSNDDDECNTPVAPPTDMELSRTKPSEKTYTTTTGNSVSPMSGPPTVNKFQRPKTRVMRQNYVDIFNSSGSTVKTNVPPEALFPTTYDHTTSPKMFIPQSVPSVAEASTDFESQESYNTSQLDTEEKSQPHAAPLMFDPAEFDSRSSSMGSQKHMLGRNNRRTYPT